MRLPALAAALLLFLAVRAHADTVYTSESAYAAATGGASTTISFNGIAPSGGFVLETNPFTLGGSTFNFSSGSSGFIIDPGYYGSSYAGGGFLNIDYTTPTDTLTVTLPSVTAISFDYGGLFGPASPFMVTLSDGFTTTLSTGDSIEGTNSLAFAGITSGTLLTSITFTLPDTPEFNALDNLSSGQAVTPEPSSLLLLGTGVLGFAGTVRRRRA